MGRIAQWLVVLRSRPSGVGHSTDLQRDPRGDYPSTAARFAALIRLNCHQPMTSIQMAPASKRLQVNAELSGEECEATTPRTKKERAMPKVILANFARCCAVALAEVSLPVSATMSQTA